MPVSLEQPTSPGTERTVEDAACRSTHRAVPHGILAEREGRAAARAGRRLEPRARDVVTMRFGLEWSTHTLREIARLTGDQPRRVRQIEQRALAHLRRVLLRAG